MRIADSRSTLIFVAATTLALGLACGKRGAAPMPPAQGSGAAALPELPVIEKTNVKDEATAVPPTEGRTTGTTFPRAEAQLGPNAEGDRVRKGQVLFRQDARDAALRVEQAKVAARAAGVNLRLAETEHERNKVMFEQKAINQMAWDQIVGRLDSARVSVQQAEVAQSMAEKALADATVKSPIDGLVTAKLKSEGEMATMMPPTIVLVVQDQSTLELRFRLPEKSLTEVKPGDALTARFEALGMAREAKVLRINPAVDARSRTVEVVAMLNNKDGVLKSGLLANVEVAAKSAPALGTAEASKAAKAQGAQ
jgi:multidrug efflux pump subunit AcrA (membrane-fusion protein)